MYTTLAATHRDVINKLSHFGKVSPDEVIQGDHVWLLCLELHQVG